MSEIDVPPQDVDVQELADIFLLLVAVEPAVSELLPYVGQFLVDALLLQLAGAGIPQVGDEGYQASHGGHVARLVPAEEPSASAGTHFRRERHVGDCGRASPPPGGQTDNATAARVYDGDGSGFGQGLCRRTSGDAEVDSRKGSVIATRRQLEDQGSRMQRMDEWHELGELRMLHVAAMQLFTLRVRSSAMVLDILHFDSQAAQPTFSSPA